MFPVAYRFSPPPRGLALVAAGAIAVSGDPETILASGARDALASRSGRAGARPERRHVAGGMAPRGVRSSARLSAAPPPAEARAPRSVSPRAGRLLAAARRARAAERAREVEDGPRLLRDKCRRLARALRNAKHLVVSVLEERW